MTVGNINATKPVVSYAAYTETGGEYVPYQWTRENIYVRFSNTTRHLENCVYWYQIEDGERIFLEPDEDGMVQLEAQEGSSFYHLGITSEFGADSDAVILKLCRDTTEPDIEEPQIVSWAAAPYLLEPVVSDDGSGIAAVSYTHLDVYKRQVPWEA